MKILSTRHSNYGSFRGEHEFVFSGRGLTLVVGDNRDEPRMNSNGSGKSMAFDALDWGTFGVVPRDDHVDSIIHDGEDEVSVTNYYEMDDGRPLVSQREKRRGKPMVLKYWKDGVEFTALDTKELQRMLELELGMDRSVFHATVLYGQTDQFNFATAKDIQRLDILTKILDLGEIDVWSESVGVLLRGVQDEIDSLRLKIETQRSRIEVTRNSLPTFDSSASAWDQERGASLQAAVRTLNEHLGHLETARAMAAQRESVEGNLLLLQTNNNEIGGGPGGGPAYDWSQFETEVSRADRASFKQWTETKFKIEVSGKELKRRRGAMASTKTGNCTECGQLLPEDPSHVQAELAKLDASIGESRNLWVEADGKVKELQAKIDGYDRDRSEAQRLHQEADRVNLQKQTEYKQLLKEINEADAYVQKAGTYVQSLRATMADTEAKTNPWVEKKREAEDALGRDIVVLASDEKLREDKESRREYLEFWKTAFGPRGLKNYILDARLKEMNDAANEWVRLITGGTIWVRIETQTMGRSTKKLSNKMNIRVFRYNPDGTVGARNFKSWSGGEKARVSWAIDFGLSRLIAARATKTYDLMILDEVFKYVDSAGGEAVIEMLRHLRREKSSIFVIEHDASFQSQFENKVLVRKENGQSRIIEESDHESSSEESKTETEEGDVEEKPKRKVRRKSPPRRKAVPKRRPRKTPG